MERTKELGIQQLHLCTADQIGCGWEADKKMVLKVQTGMREELVWLLFGLLVHSSAFWILLVEVFRQFYCIFPMMLAPILTPNERIIYVEIISNGLS